MCNPPLDGALLTPYNHFTTQWLSEKRTDAQALVTDGASGTARNRAVNLSGKRTRKPNLPPEKSVLIYR